MTVLPPKAPEHVRWIARTLEKAGHETWAVGGAVRDILQGVPSVDWDLTTRARPEAVRALFRRTVPLGLEYGTVGVLSPDGTMYEVTTFRRDVETDGRHAVVAFADTLEEDLSRRDFTINAIAWHPLREEMLDPHGGAADLEAQILRTVGNPTDRFAEDYLRVLRGLRFAGRFGLSIEAGTWGAMRDAASHLVGLSPERVREELVKVLAADPRPSVALRLYAESGALACLYPELEALHGADRQAPGWSRTLATLDHLPPGRPELRLAALFRLIEVRPAAALLVRLRLSTAQADEAALRAAAPRLPAPGAPHAAFRRWLSRYGAIRLPALARIELAEARADADAAADGAGNAAREVEADAYRRTDPNAATSGRQFVTPESVVASWREAKAVLASRPPLALGDLALDGRGLVRLGLRPGPIFGRILDTLLDRVLDDPTLNDEALLSTLAAGIAAEAAGSTRKPGEGGRP